MKTKSLVRLALLAPIALFALVGCTQQLISQAFKERREEAEEGSPPEE